MRKAIFWTAAILTITELCSSDVIPVPATEDSIQGTWIGLPYEVNDYCRLVLTNGHGYFARSFELEKPMLYTVDSYELDKQNGVTFRMSSVSTNAYAIAVSGKVAPNELQIVIKSPGGGWAHKSLLYREETVERMLGDLKYAIERLAK